MGGWFVKYFLGGHSTVLGYDVRPIQMRPNPDFRVTSSIKDCVSTADYVLICTPTDQISKGIKEAVKYMKNGAVLIEISSVKEAVFSVLKKLGPTVVPVSLHPMFGPNAGRSAPRMLLVPVRSKSLELKVVNQLFHDPVINVVTNPIIHDKLMGVVLGLTYFINLALAETISKQDLAILKEVSGTTFSVQLAIVESILGEDPRLVEMLIASNSESFVWISKYLSIASDLFRRSKERGFIRKRALRVSSSLSRDSNYSGSNKKLYEIVSLLQPQNR